MKSDKVVMTYVGRTVHNTYDTKIEVDSDARINVVKRLDKRIGLVYRAVERLEAATSWQIAEHVNARVGSNYRTEDVAYALGRLEKAGMAERVGSLWKLGKVKLSNVKTVYRNKLLAHR